MDDEPLPDEKPVPDGRDEALPLSDDDPAALTDPIVQIVIEGNDTIETPAILRLVRSAVGRAPVEQQIREDVRALYSTRWFFSVEPRYRRDERGLVLVFRVIERPMVEAIEYRGNDRITTKFLEKLTGLRQGSPFDVSVNREAVRRIIEHYHEKGFPYAKVNLLKGNRREDREVIFEIDEGPKVIVGSVRFTGNDSFSGALLKTKLAMKPAFIGLPFLGKYKPERVPDDVSALKQYYHSLGYFDVEIEKEVNIDASPWNPISFGTAHAIITYHIHEGPRFQIRNLVLEGNQIYRTEELAQELKLRSGDFYNARFMTRDVESIKDRYGKLGRLFAKVEPMPRFLDESGTMDLVYQIDEDRVYTIRHINVHIDGDFPHTKESVVLNRILVHPGDLANPALINKSVRRLNGPIFERTGPNAPRVEISKVEEKPDPRRSRLMQAGGTVRGQSPDSSAGGFDECKSQSLIFSGGAAIRGQTPDASDDNAVITLVQQPPPQYPFGGTTTDPGTQPIMPRFVPGFAPNLFPWLYPPVATMPPADSSPLDLNFFQREGQSGRLSLGVGVNSNSGAVGNIVLQEDNFDILRLPTSFEDIRNGTAWRGGGQQFRLEAVPGNIVSRYLLSWTQPVADTGESYGVSGYFFNRFYPDWKEDRLGGRINYGKQLWNQETSLLASLRLESVDITRPVKDPVTGATVPLLADVLGSSFLSTARIAMAHDTRDSQFLPATGHYLMAGYEQAFGEYNYPRADAEAHQYFTIVSRPDGGGRHVLSLGVQAAWTGDNTPIFERYFAGGFQSFRGFQFRGVTPVQFVGGRKVGIGGQWSFLGGAEYMLPLTADEMIAAVAFCDLGTVEDRRVSFNNFRVTVGGGLRITVPVMGPAPIALDWGIPLVKQDFDDTRLFSFSVGISR